jgi:CheY-like chemotaxis protein
VLRRLTKLLLERAGYRVLAEANGLDALTRLEAEDLRVDLAITDVVMPRMDGRALAKRLLGEDRAGAVLYMSGYTATSEPGGAVLDPDAPFLPKPFTAEQLLEAVRVTLSGSGGRVGPPESGGS